MPPKPEGRNEEMGEKKQNVEKGVEEHEKGFL